MHEANKFIGSFMHNLILVITTVDMSCTSQNFFYSIIIINMLACILPAYFHIHFHLEKEKERFHFNVLLSIELFILFWTLWYIVGHIWREYELSLYLSFAYCFTKCHKGVPPCLLYKVPRRFLNFWASIPCIQEQ